NPIHRLDADRTASEWLIVERDRAEHPQTGAVIIAGQEAVTVRVPVGGDRPDVVLDLQVPDDCASGSVPEVSTNDAAHAMTQLLIGAAGGILPEVRGGIARETVPYSPDLVADYATVTGNASHSQHAAPDVLVGPGWPAIFAALSD